MNLDDVQRFSDAVAKISTETHEISRKGKKIKKQKLPDCAQQLKDLGEKIHEKIASGIEEIALQEAKNLTIKFNQLSQIPMFKNTSSNFAYKRKSIDSKVTAIIIKPLHINWEEVKKLPSPPVSLKENQKKVFSEKPKPVITSSTNRGIEAERNKKADIFSSSLVHLQSLQNKLKAIEEKIQDSSNVPGWVQKNCTNLRERTDRTIDDMHYLRDNSSSSNKSTAEDIDMINRRADGLSKELTNYIGAFNQYERDLSAEFQQLLTKLETTGRRFDIIAEKIAPENSEMPMWVHWDLQDLQKRIKNAVSSMKDLLKNSSPQNHTGRTMEKMRIMNATAAQLDKEIENYLDKFANLNNKTILNWLKTHKLGG